MAQINKPTDYFNTKLYSADATNTINITGVGHQPDWVWIKRRNGASDHVLFDSVRGTQKGLFSSLTNAEATEGGNRGLTSFDSDGFTIGPQLQDIAGSINAPGGTYVSWNWKAGGTASSNTDGSITSSVSADTTSGFSIVSYTGTGTSGTDTFGHGLGVTPSMVIFKNRTDVVNWSVYHKSLTNGANSYLELNQTNAESNLSLSPPLFGTPSSTTMGAGHFNATNGSGDSIIAYCFAEKKGFSKFGSYTGNGNADGTFVYTGFKPAFVMNKLTSGADDWQILDNKRNTFNVTNKYLKPNSSDAVTTNNAIDFLSNGFKLRTSAGSWNPSGGSFIYMAFAENPLVGTNNIPTTAR